MSLKKILVSSIAAAAVATTVFGATVTTSTNGKGNYLNYPAYYATTDGWSTNIRVVNTNTTHAVVAKVVVREYATSKELLDFPIYLSPGDVWTADLVNQGSLSAVNVVSTDDSSPEVPMNQALNNNNTLVGTSYGYVEIIAVAERSAAEIATAQSVTWSQFQPLSKAAIKANFNAAGTTGAVGAGWEAPTNTLFGQQVVTATTAGAEKSMTLAAHAQDVVLTVAEDTNRDISTGTLFGVDTTADTIFNSVGVELAIRTNLLKTAVHAINYTDGGAETQVLLTQAYKHTNDDESVVEGDAIGTTTATLAAPYYVASAAETAATGSTSRFFYMGRKWDNTEITYVPDETIYSGSVVTTYANPCPTEICYIYYSDMATTYASGWMNLTLGTDVNGAGNDAVPTIATVMTGVKVNGVGITNMLPASFE
jgi:hypothetical protein